MTEVKEARRKKEIKKIFLKSEVYGKIAKTMLPKSLRRRASLRTAKAYLTMLKALNTFELLRVFHFVKTDELLGSTH